MSSFNAFGAEAAGCKTESTDLQLHPATGILLPHHFIFTYLDRFKALLGKTAQGVNSVRVVRTQSHSEAAMETYRSL